MHIAVPTSARLQNIESFVKRISDSESPELRISLPATYFSVHPLVLAATAAAGIRARQSGKDVIIDDIPDTPSCRYLQRMGLFSSLDIDPNMKVREREAIGRFMPLRTIRTGLQLSEFAVQLPPLLHAEDHRQVEPIQYVMSELVRNTLEHAGIGYASVVAAQVYPKSGIVSIGVADCGRGIASSLSDAHTVATDIDALHLAMQPGVTGKTSQVGGTADNAGAGLFFCKAMAQVSHNYLVVHSGSAMIKFLKAPATQQVNAIYADPRFDRATRHDDLPGWPGTLVGMDIDVNSNRDFAGFMDFVRGTYATEVDSKRRSKSKKRARFE
ncbi:ATP-binding protein [Cellulomonas hominis]|uniref:ATP-binding protein n=1 Tax=Cellulomonas hominis TaxID=156981 RepID=A0A7Z8NT56_9CELL|nr:ATP-binding protein [Cellulomonas hominis]TKR27332.1 ATP-binding protein [Cellulomonas hominis]